MPIDMCRCGRQISISRLPGGNPIAQRYPDSYATRYGECDRCRKKHCDRCIEAAGGTCPDCGKRVTIQGPPPGPAGEMPPEMQRMLDALDRGQPLTPKVERKKRQGPVAFAVSVGIAAALAGLLFALRSATAPESAGYRVGDIGFHVVVTAALLLVVAPLVGSLATITVGELIRRAFRPGVRGILRLNGFWIIGYILLLLASPWFVYHTHYALGWPGWRIAFVYAAILGALLGGIRLLATHSSQLKKQMPGGA